MKDLSSETFLDTGHLCSTLVFSGSTAMPASETQEGNLRLEKIYNFQGSVSDWPRQDVSKLLPISLSVY